MSQPLPSALRQAPWPLNFLCLSPLKQNHVRLSVRRYRPHSPPHSPPPSMSHLAEASSLQTFVPSLVSTLGPPAVSQPPLWGCSSSSRALPLQTSESPFLSKATPSFDLTRALSPALTCLPKHSPSPTTSTPHCAGPSPAALRAPPPPVPQASQPPFCPCASTP